MEHVKLEKLAPHPALQQFPLLDDAQLQVLTQSVAEHGVLKPLVAVKDGNDGRGLVIDGRNRYLAAERNLLGSVPVEWAPEGTDPIVYAIESAIAGRNLTRSGVVLLLVEQHPDLAESRTLGQQRGLKKGKNPNDSPCDNITRDAFNMMADRYNVPREYFSQLLKIRESASDVEWDQVRANILSGESSIAALYAGLGGRLATKGKNRKDPDYSRLLTQATMTVANAFKSWTKIKFRDDKHLQNTEGNIHEMFRTMPDAVRAINADVIVQHWPEHEVANLLKMIKAKK